MSGADDLFSHPDAHSAHTSGPRNDEQKSYTDLFREPPSEPESGRQHS